VSAHEPQSPHSAMRGLIALFSLLFLAAPASSVHVQVATATRLITIYTQALPAHETAALYQYAAQAVRYPRATVAPHVYPAPAAALTSIVCEGVASCLVLGLYLPDGTLLIAAEAPPALRDSTIVHEFVHSLQPVDQDRCESEREAFAVQARFEREVQHSLSPVTFDAAFYDCE
jgi:hypothetical protein